ncbi:MAG: hypothetical protein ACOX2U_01315 [Limisphaerales bacterium]|nr:hypothetical protein [Verrucomicrobiota bacterium]
MIKNNLNKIRFFKGVGLSCVAGTLIFGPAATARLQAQVSRQRSTSGEAAAESILRGQTETKEGHFLSWDKWNFGIRPRIDVEYNSNVYRSSRPSGGGSKDDIILRPEVKLDFYRAVSDFNSIDFTLGIGTDLYTKNTEINTYSPLISPDSEFAYHMFVGQTHIKLRESFSYQEDINSIYTVESGGDFVDLESVRFGRYDNKLGGEVSWDTGAFLFTGSFDWQWFHSNSSRYEYMDRNSGLFSQSVTYFITPRMQTGLEVKDPVHFFSKHGKSNSLNDQFRIDVGPFFAMQPGKRLKLRAGAGYNYATFFANDNDPVTDNVNDWYAYGEVDYLFTPWLYNTLGVRRDNRLSWNSDNQEVISIHDNIRFSYIRDFAIDIYGSINFYKETGIQYRGRNTENSTYYRGGIRIAYTFLKRWEPSLRYTYYSYERDNATYSNYDVHQVMLGIQYTF